MTVRQVLGDELATLKGQGKSDKEIITIAKDRLKNPPQKQIAQEPIVQQQPQSMTTWGTPTPAWYKGDSDSGLANFAGNVLRGVGHTGLSYANLLQGGDEDTTKLLQKLERITERHKDELRTPERKAEVQKLQDEYSKAETFSEKFKAGVNTIVDTLANPNEWQVGEFIGENLDIINALPAGKTILTGMTIGGVTNAAQAGAFTLPRTDKTLLDAGVDATLGGVAGTFLGGATAGVTPTNVKGVKATRLDEAGNVVEGEVVGGAKVDENGVLLDPFNTGLDPIVLEAEIVKQKTYEAFATLIQAEEASVKNVDAVVKNIGDEMLASGATPEMIELRIAEEVKPSEQSLLISNILNDNEPLTPRLSGLNIQQAILNSIESSTKTTPEFIESLAVHGLTEEHANAAAHAYDTKEIAHYSTWAHDKLTSQMTQMVDVEAVKEQVQKDMQSISKVDIKDIETLKQHERFDELLDMTRTLKASDKTSPQKLDAPRTVTPLEDGTAHVAGATYEKNYAHDFLLTESKVKRIEAGKATLKDVEDLKADLDMMDNNPAYRLPTEEELRAIYEAQAYNPALIIDDAKFAELQQRFDPETFAESQEMFGYNTTIEDVKNDTSYTRDLARDTQNAELRDTSDERVDATRRGSSNADIEQTQRVDGRVGLPQQSDSSTSNSSSNILGKSSDTELHSTDRADSPDTSTTSDREFTRSGRVDGDGILVESREQAEAITEFKQTENKSSDESLDSSDRGIQERIDLQKSAELIQVVENSPQNIHDTLPMLLREQREDVIKAESRFFKEDKRGMLFTNGTGTGKTFTGLGVVKRFEKRGKKDVVIVVPSEAKALDWIEDAELLNLKIRKLKDTKDSGEGEMIITTYENFRDNVGLRQRSIDLLVADESHKIVGNKDGKHTQNLDALREITGYYENAKSRAKAEFADQRAKLDAKIDEVGGRYEDAAVPYIAQLKDLKDQEQLLAREINSKTKTVFLSASPFASHKSLRYADDYLFNFDKNKWNENGEYRGYNAGDDEDQFFISNFGYKMRYNKLTLPDAEVNVDMMERAFAEKLRESGAMSGRMLSVDKDYQRSFVLVENEIGKKIDAGFEKLNDDKEFEALRGVMRASYMDTVSLMEAIKATEAVSRIKGHLEAGRKVVVYHTFVDVNPAHPFRFEKHINDAIAKAAKGEYDNSNEMRTKLDAEYAAFKTKYPELYNMDLGELDSPTSTIQKAFGDDVVMFNRLAGSGKKKSANKDKFNNNEVDIIMVNESGKEGISLHDKAGDKQRVLINLTLPIKPIDMIQVEGRIYRTGQKSDAIFEYLTLHTNFEKRYFGSSINERVATVENLAMGEQSRALRSAIKDGYLSAEFVEPHALDGTGGKAFDARAEGDKVMDNPFNFAKTLYFGKQKGRQNHKGADFFATPDPLGFKMVEWADIKANDKVLEPSAGVGAIGKWFPADSVNHFVEQSGNLCSDLGIAVQGKVMQMDFMDLDLHNKYDAIVMNPPFGKASVTAIQHLQKAMKHTSMNGRIVILAPNNMMEKASFKKMLDDKEFSGWVLQDEIKLPAQTFERAGTKVMASVYVFNKTNAKDKLSIQERYTKDIYAQDINNFFDEIEDLSIDRRAVPASADEIHATVKDVVSGNSEVKPYDENVYEFVQKNKNVKDKLKSIVVNHVSDEFVSVLKEHTGLDLSGYDRVIDNYFVIHILDEHGGDKEYARGQIPIEITDIAKIPSIVAHAHKITLSKNSAGRDVINYESIVGDKYFYFEEVRSGVKELTPQTLYKRDSEKMISAKTPSPLLTPETELSYDTSITQLLEFVKHEHTKTGEIMPMLKLSKKLPKEQYKELSKMVRADGAYYNKYAGGFVFENEAKALRFKKSIDDGSVKLHAMMFPYADKLADVMMNFDKYADAAYKHVSDFVRDVDADGVPKAVRESKNIPHAMLNNFFGWMRDNMVLGGGRANHYIDTLRGYTDMKASIADEALNTRAILDEMLSKDDSQDLVRALGGDLPADELSTNARGAYELYRGLIDIQTDELIKAGALDPKYAKEDYIKRYYFEHIAKEKSFVNMKGSEANSAKFAREDLDLDERIAMGQVEDAGYVVAKTILEQKDQLNRARFFNKLADEVASDDLVDGYVQVPDTKIGVVNKWGALNGKYVPKQVFDDLRGSAKMFDDMNGIEQFVAGWMSTVQHIKTNMTVKNVGTHLYNVLSNGYLAYLDGHVSQLGRVLADPKLYKELHAEANRFGLDSMLDDLEGVSFKENSNDGVMLKLLKNAYMAEGTTVGNAMRKAYAHEDAAFKIAAYLKRKEDLQLSKFLDLNEEIKAEYEAGFFNGYNISKRYKEDIKSISLSEDELRRAFEGVDEVYVNYGTPLPAGVKNLDRSGLFPFMHYTWKATPIFMKQMMRHPYKVGLLHVAAGSYGLSKIWGDQDERDKVTPEYMNDGFNMLGLDNYTLAPEWMSSKGNDSEYINIGRSVPAMRFLNKSPISIFLGLDGGILANMFGITVQGRDNKGYAVDGGKYDSTSVKMAKRASAMAEQAMPPLFPALPLVVRPKVDSRGKEVKDTTEVVAFGGRYFQKAYDAYAGKKDKRDNPLLVTDVVKQSAGLKLQKVDKLSEAQKSVNLARSKFVRSYNSAKSSRERAEAKRTYIDEVKEVRGQLARKDAVKLKVKTNIPGSKKNSTKVFTKQRMVKL